MYPKRVQGSDTILGIHSLREKGPLPLRIPCFLEGLSFLNTGDLHGHGKGSLEFYLGGGLGCSVEGRVCEKQEVRAAKSKGFPFNRFCEGYHKG